MKNKVNEEWKQVNGLYKCPECGKEYSKRGILSHIFRVHTERGRNHKSISIFISSGGKHKQWNKGLTAQTDERVKKAKETLLNGYVTGRLTPSWTGRKHTEETKRKQAIHGGIREGSGRGKQGTYCGYRCQSSWELAWVVYNIDHNIKFSRNKKGFEYTFNNKVRKYYPDFILEDGTYIEIKGYMTLQNKAKIENFKLPLIVIDKVKIQMYLNYVIEKYGKKFIELYNKDLVY
jgi:hypothetical protein